MDSKLDANLQHGASAYLQFGLDASWKQSINLSRGENCLCGALIRLAVASDGLKVGEDSLLTG